MFLKRTDPIFAISGITGLSPGQLKAFEPGVPYVVNQLKFGTGQNSFKATEAGQIFVTEYPPTSSYGTLNSIGVFHEKQQFVIQLSEETAFMQNARIKASDLKNSIWVMPGNRTSESTFTVIKRYK